MLIENGCWVTLRYRIYDLNDESLEDRPRELRYLHGGYGSLFARIEAALTGRVAGDQLSVVLEPEDHFGDYDADLLVLVPLERLPEGVAIGMSFDALPGEPDAYEIDQAKLELEPVWTITDVADGVAVLDGNHPLAGLALRFEIQIIEVELASDVEIEVEQDLAGVSGSNQTLH